MWNRICKHAASSERCVKAERNMGGKANLQSSHLKHRQHLDDWDPLRTHTNKQTNPQKEETQALWLLQVKCELTSIWCDQHELEQLKAGKLHHSRFSATSPMMIFPPLLLVFSTDRAVLRPCSCFPRPWPSRKPYFCMILWATVPLRVKNKKKKYSFVTFCYKVPSLIQIFSC